METGLTPAQQGKIAAAKKYIKNSKDADSLHNLVVMVSPSTFGKITLSNTDTVWTRVERPVLIKIQDIIAYARAFGITEEQFLQIALRQKKHNEAEKKKGNPIGRKKYKEHPYVQVRSAATARNSKSSKKK
jgi:hypothetical protein